jgi:hypothetical protein
LGAQGRSRHPANTCSTFANMVATGRRSSVSGHKPQLRFSLMPSDDLVHQPSPQVRRVIARVSLTPEISRPEIRRRDTFTDWISADLPAWLTNSNREDLSLGVLLSAEDRHGALIHARTSFGVAGPRSGSGAAWCRYHPACSGKEGGDYHVCALDISESIDQMLGRDPELHRPPCLAWHSLLAALLAINLTVTVEQLQAIPMTLILDNEVEAELDHIQRA